MKQAYLDLIKFALAEGASITVHEMDVEKSTSYNEIKAAVEGIDFAEMTIYPKEPEYEGQKGIWVQTAIGWGNAPEETIGDWSVPKRPLDDKGPFNLVDRWDRAYTEYARTHA